MTVLVTGSAGHLGEGLVRTLRAAGRGVVGFDVLSSPFTDLVGSVADRAAVAAALEDVDAVVHAAARHKPHLATHEASAFVETNVAGTLTLLESAAAAGVAAFVFVSTTSAFGAAVRPEPGQPAAWITEEVRPVPKNVYGVTKVAAEELCELAYADHRLPCVVLRASRFFPEVDDDEAVRSSYPAENVYVNELLYRRVDLADVVGACLAALERAPALGFGRYVVSATSPFAATEVADLRIDAPGVVRRRFPDYEALYSARGWRMFPSIDRVYVNRRARLHLGWAPVHDFAWALGRLQDGGEVRSALAREVGAKRYHLPGGVDTTGASSPA
jgi:UDP-glucose 4-epimerase